MRQYEMNATTASTVALQLYQHIQSICSSLGISPATVVLDGPTEDNHWAVSWRDGPIDWAVYATNNGAIYEEQRDGTFYKQPPTFPGLTDGTSEWFADIRDGSTVVIRPQHYTVRAMSRTT